MDISIFLILPALATIAFFVKGLTGFGPALIFIPVGALLFAPQPIIVASSFLDLAAGLIMWRTVGSIRKVPFLAGIIGAMAAGTVIGVFLLTWVPADTYRFLLGLVVLLLGLWFALFRSRIHQDRLRNQLPDTCDRKDIGFSTLAGVLGGLFGISGPPILWHLGRRFRMNTFRDLLIVVFVFAAVARIVSFSAAGLVTTESALYAAASAPGLFAGLYLGQKVFLRIDEALFSRSVGAVLVVFAFLLMV
ncbi:sulfite exporter TauE/SafE family protein [Balneolales bacterium ANBcel1]|nr:sulfite exporter TauE/SafE family protein [Balneolales bacterium ANBcel1]